MRISSVNDNKQNTNFGMLKVIDATTPELAKEARGIIKKLASEKVVRVRDVIKPEFDEGIDYLLNSRDMPMYRRQQDKVFLIGNELEEYPSGGTITMGDWFKSRFKKAKRLTMKQLRELYDNLLVKQNTQSEAEKSLKKAQTGVKTAWRDIRQALSLEQASE